MTFAQTIPVTPQSITFDRSRWTVSKARSWLRSHGYRVGKVDVTENLIRFRQHAPGRCRSKTFRFGAWGAGGIKPVYCQRRRNPYLYTPYEKGKDPKELVRRLKGLGMTEARLNDALGRVEVFVPDMGDAKHTQERVVSTLKVLDRRAPEYSWGVDMGSPAKAPKRVTKRVRAAAALRGGGRSAQRAVSGEEGPIPPFGPAYTTESRHRHRYALVKGLTVIGSTGLPVADYYVGVAVASFNAGPYEGLQVHPAVAVMRLPEGKIGYIACVIASDERRVQMPLRKTTAQWDLKDAMSSAEDMAEKIANEWGRESRRDNPTLLVLSNPSIPHEAPARKAWGKFHLKSGSSASVTSIPDVPGLPKTVVSLGAWEGGETEAGRVIRVRRSPSRGPWVVTCTLMKRLWVVGTSSLGLRSGERLRAIYYYPPKQSGKHDRSRGYRHEFGEGGRLPKSRWPEVYPTIRQVARAGGRAVEVVGRFKITSRGIVG